MKKVILSADGDSTIYLVPDIVADNLEVLYTWSRILLLIILKSTA